MLAAEEENKIRQNQEPNVSSDVWELRLYVAGQSQKSIAAYANLKIICGKHLRGKSNIEVIDLCKNPKLAAEDQILAIPTLMRMFPMPIRKVIGDLANTERVLVGLEIPKK